MPASHQWQHAWANFNHKKIPFVVLSVFQSTLLIAAPSLSTLGFSVSSDCQYHDYLESKAKLAPKKLGVINRARQYFTPKHQLALYRVQVRPHMEYCSHLWAGAPQYQLDPYDRIQRRAVRIVGDPMFCAGLDKLALRRDVFSLCVLYRIYHGEYSGNCLTFYLLPNFLIVRHKLKYHPHHLDTWHSTTVQFHRNSLPLNWGMTHLRQCFQVDTIWVPSKSASISTLKASNAPVAPLVLHGVVGGVDHLPPGDQYPRLPCLFP